jgi:hypothetical protein
MKGAGDERARHTSPAHPCVGAQPQPFAREAATEVAPRGRHGWWRWRGGDEERRTSAVAHKATRFLVCPISNPTPISLFNTKPSLTSVLGERGLYFSARARGRAGEEDAEGTFPCSATHDAATTHWRGPLLPASAALPLARAQASAVRHGRADACAACAPRRRVVIGAIVFRRGRRARPPPPVPGPVHLRDRRRVPARPQRVYSR